LPDATTMSAPTKTLETLPTRDDEGAWLAVIEASQGTRHKLKYTPEWNAFVLNGVLPVGLAFPYDFGFLPSTLGDDGDPLDVLVLADESLPPGSVVPCRIVGVIEAEQHDEDEPDAKRNDRLVAVAVKSHRHGDCRTLKDLPANVLDEIEQFFVAFNASKGGTFRPLARRGVATATKLVAGGERRFATER
jgi:inorganic pyrophosphatase